MSEIEPIYIDPTCPECGTKLVLADLLDNPGVETPFLDEWACPECYDGHGVYMDWNKEEIDELANRAKEAEEHPERMIPWEEARKTLYEGMGLTDEEIEERIKEGEDKAKNMTDEEIEEFQSKIKYLINV